MSLNTDVRTIRKRPLPGLAVHATTLTRSHMLVRSLYVHILFESLRNLLKPHVKRVAMARFLKVAIPCPPRGLLLLALAGTYGPDRYQPHPRELAARTTTGAVQSARLLFTTCPAIATQFFRGPALYSNRGSILSL